MSLALTGLATNLNLRVSYTSHLSRFKPSPTKSKRSIVHKLKTAYQNHKINKANKQMMQNRNRNGQYVNQATHHHSILPMIMGVTMGIIIIVILGAVAYHFYKKSKENKTTNN